MDVEHPTDVCAALSRLAQEIIHLRSQISDLSKHFTVAAPIRESLRARRERLEARAILLLGEFGGNRQRIAQEINVPESTLRSWDKFEKAYRYCLALDQADRVARSAGFDMDDLE